MTVSGLFYLLAGHGSENNHFIRCGLFKGDSAEDTLSSVQSECSFRKVLGQSERRISGPQPIESHYIPPSAMRSSTASFTQRLLHEFGRRISKKNLFRFTHVVHLIYNNSNSVASPPLDGMHRNLWTTSPEYAVLTRRNKFHASNR